jgi:predicted glycoside hydrolase/deacetylase ChbG (UPF0249 family)
VRELARSLRVPLRQVTRDVRYCGDFYGQTDAGEPLPDRIATKALTRLLETLPPGCTELACHPAAHGDLTTMYADQRMQERDTLCSDEVRQCVRRLRIELCSFHDFRNRRRMSPRQGSVNPECRCHSSSKRDDLS